MAKKLLCVLLCMSVIFSFSAVFSCAQADEGAMNIAVASDLHYCQPGKELEGEIDDDIFWYANRRAAMENESGFIIDEFLNQCAKGDCEYVLISGDMANDGRVLPQQHEDIAKKFSDFEKATGKKIFVIDGNHDLGSGSKTQIEDFKRIYADFGYNEALCVDSESCSYTADLGEKYRLIALDSCDHSASTSDGLTLKRVSWLKKQAKAAHDNGRYIILMMHHNLLDHMPIQRVLSKDFIVRNHTFYAGMFADMGIKTVFTGHEHCSDVSEYTSSKGNKIYDFATTSLTMYPLTYRTVSFSDEKIVYSTKAINKIDTDALSKAVNGYTDSQLSLMNDGLNSYALVFMKAGIRYRLELSLSMEKIGISEGEPFYILVNTAVSGLEKILSMPLYGEGSVSELANKYNLHIPESDFENGWDLVTDFVASHYEGGEDKELDSTEITLLLRTAALILRDDLSGVADEVLLKTANSLLSRTDGDKIASSLTKLGTDVFGPVTPGEYFILAVASPIIFEFSYDSDGTDDNEGELTGYAPEVDEKNAENIYEKIKAYFSDILRWLNQFVKIIKNK